MRSAAEMASADRRASWDLETPVERSTVGARSRNRGRAGDCMHSRSGEGRDGSQRTLDAGQLPLLGSIDSAGLGKRVRSPSVLEGSSPTWARLLKDCDDPIQ